MKLIDTSVGVVGCGNLGGALIRGISGLKSGRPRSLVIFDSHSERAQKLSSAGVVVAKDIPALLVQSSVVIVAVKPVDIDGVLSAIKSADDSVKIRCLISVAAGVSVSRITQLIGAKCPVIRVMPNLPSVIGKGMSGIYSGASEDSADSFVLLTQALFGAIGETVVVKKESDINIVTSLSAGGPAYTALFIEALADGGVKMGLTREQSLALSIQTVLGTAEMLKQSQMHPSQLREQVASAGGTTIHGLHALEKGAVRASVVAAVEAATRRAEEMQKISDGSKN